MSATSFVTRWLKQVQGRMRPSLPREKARKFIRHLHPEELEPRLLLATDSYLLPGDSSGLFQVGFTLNQRHAVLTNEVGVYAVDDDAGRVAGLLPSDPGYAAAAMNRGI